jgi:hypothetical protein
MQSLASPKIDDRSPQPPKKIRINEEKVEMWKILSLIPLKKLMNFLHYVVVSSAFLSSIFSIIYLRLKF